MANRLTLATGQRCTVATGDRLRLDPPVNAEYSANIVGANTENLYTANALAGKGSHFIIAGWIQVDTSAYYTETDLINVRTSNQIFRQAGGELGWYMRLDSPIADGTLATGNDILGVWNSIMLTYNNSTRERRIYMNNAFESSSTFGSGTPNVATLSSWTTANANPPTAATNARVCCWGFWHPPSMYNNTDLLAMHQYLHNGGSQIWYSDMGGADAHLADLSHFYNFNEFSDGTGPVTRSDSVGSAHLTDQNTVASQASTPASP